MPYLHIDIAGEFSEEAEHQARRIAYQHFQNKDKYEKEEEFISDLVGKIVNITFLTNARYTEKLVMTMLKELFSDK